MAPEPRVYLYMDDVPNIQKAMESARSHSFDRVVIRIKNLKLTDRNTGERTNAVGIRSDLLLNPERWRHNSILKINEQCDISSRHREIQLQAQRNVKREIEWANHLDQFSCVLVDLNKDELCSLSRELMNKFDKFGCVLAELPMVDKSFFSQNYANNTNKTDLTTACARVWHRWNTFRIAADFNSLFKVALELTPVIPQQCDLNRWFGEPVELVIIPSFLFEHAKNNIALKPPYIDLCREFVNKTRAHFAVKCPQNDPFIPSYARYLKRTLARTSLNHECNRIREPGLLLPLTKKVTMNNCENYSKMMFKVYGEALRLAINDILQTKEKIQLMICGKNGWTFLHQVMKIVGDAQSVKVFLYEEDVNNMLIGELMKSLYKDKDIIRLNDGNDEQYHHTMDIAVSLTLQSIYQDQWLKFNFVSVKNYLQPFTLLIPKQSSLIVAPVASPRCYSDLYEGNVVYNRHKSIDGFEAYSIRSQTICPVYTQNVSVCADATELFTSKYSCENGIHISKDIRIKRIEFTLNRDCIVTGFSGYFTMVLYKNVQFNTQNLAKEYNTKCVPMTYFPLQSPQTFARDTTLKTLFWSNADTTQHRYWYEWQIEHPAITRVHNLNGNAYSLTHYLNFN